MSRKRTLNLSPQSLIVFFVKVIEHTHVYSCTRELKSQVLKVKLFLLLNVIELHVFVKHNLFHEIFC